MNAYLHFLRDDFTVWGMTFQYWMPLAVMVFVISMTVWKERL
jgi:hypothetical protein